MSSLTSALPRPCTAAWLLLLGLAIVTFHLGSLSPGRALMAAVLALTIVKGQLVASYFMGLRKVRSLWRIVMASYLLIVGGLIALAYLIA